MGTCGTENASLGLLVLCCGANSGSAVAAHKHTSRLRHRLTSTSQGALSSPTNENVAYQNIQYCDWLQDALQCTPIELILNHSVSAKPVKTLNEWGVPSGEVDGQPIKRFQRKKQLSKWPEWWWGASESVARGWVVVSLRLSHKSVKYYEVSSPAYSHMGYIRQMSLQSRAKYTRRYRADILNSWMKPLIKPTKLTHYFEN